MERGAVASNCEMEFTLPNATISQVTKDPLGTLELQKVNNKGEGVDGALLHFTEIVVVKIKLEMQYLQQLMV